jgi:hypothetical protein
MAAPTDHSVRHPRQPAPGRPANPFRLRLGRPGEFPNRPRMELRAPSRAPLPLASIGRHRLTSLRTSEMISFSSPRGVRSRNSGGLRYPPDPTRLFFRCLFDSQAHELWHCCHDSHRCAKARKAQLFSNCGGETSKSATCAGWPSRAAPRRLALTAPRLRRFDRRI